MQGRPAKMFGPTTDATCPENPAFFAHGCGTVWVDHRPVVREERVSPATRGAPKRSSSIMSASS
jgi:hypothetical protein